MKADPEPSMNAGTAAPKPSGAERVELLVFEVASHTYALVAADVLEIVRAVSIVPLPRAPQVVEGVVNVRGSVLPVLDIRKRFRLPPKRLAPSDHFILAHAGAYTVVLRADRVLDLRQVPAADIADAKQVLPHSEYVAGVVKLPGALVLLHDVRTFLSQGEAAALAEPLTALASGSS
jgi:purine-binding chemotaxis protein CheW